MNCLIELYKKALDHFNLHIQSKFKLPSCGLIGCENFDKGVLAKCAES